MPEAADRGPHGLVVVGVDAVAGEHDRIGAGGVRAADHGAGVAGVAHVGADDEDLWFRDARRSLLNHRRQGYVEEAAGRDDALRGDRPAEGGDRVVVDEGPGDARVVDRLAECGVLLAGLEGREHLDHAAGVERLGQRLGALGEEQPVLGPGIATGEPPSRLDPAALAGERPRVRTCGREARHRQGRGSGRRGSVDVLGQGGLGGLDEHGEGRRVVDGQVGQDLAVDLDTRGLEALDEAVVGQAVGPGAGVDALDPELAEVALLLAPVVVAVDQRVGDLLLRLAVEARALAPVAGGALEE